MDMTHTRTQTCILVTLPCYWKFAIRLHRYTHRCVGEMGACITSSIAFRRRHYSVSIDVTDGVQGCLTGPTSATYHAGWAKTGPFLANVNSRSRSLYVVVRPSVCLSSVTFVRPTQAIEIFGNVFVWYLGHPWPFSKNFTKIAPGEPLRRGS